MRRILLLLLLTPSLAQAGPAVTIYSGDLAFVRDPQVLELSATSETVRVATLPERVDATSLRLALEGGARVTRLAYRMDVMGADDALDRVRGARVQVASADGRLTDGTLLSAGGAWLLVQGDDGMLHALARNEVHAVRFAGSAGGEMLRPALEAVIEDGRRGRVKGELSYLTGGLSWSATHTLVRDGARGEWSADVTIVNASGRDFVDADLKLVAGDPRRANAGPPMPKMRTMSLESSGAGQADLAEESFSEYHLYSLSRPATLRDRESQKLVMLEPRPIKLTPRYLYRSGMPSVAAQLEVVNARGSGPGAPLAAGTVRIYEPDGAGALQFAGESALRHTAEGEKFTLEVGAAFDLVAERRDLANTRVTDREREVSVEFKLRNQKKEAVTITIEEPVSGEAEILKSSHAVDRKDARTLRIDVPVPAGRETIVTYTARIRY